MINDEKAHKTYPDTPGVNLPLPVLYLLPLLTNTVAGFHTPVNVKLPEPFLALKYGWYGVTTIPALFIVILVVPLTVAKLSERAVPSKIMALDEPSRGVA